MDRDRERWNATWLERAGELEAPASFLVEHAHLLPARGRAFDVAGGAGRNAVWLAKHGLDVTMLDISRVAIDRAERKAQSAGVAKRIRFVEADLDTAELPAPLFDVVLIAHFLHRARRDELARLLHVDGMLVAMQATVRNLERHEHPRREYLVEPGELEDWVRELGFSILVAREDWGPEGRHEAEIIARRVPAPAPELEPPEPGPDNGPYR
jgi:predicted O-methyltransferase YrrM